MVGLRCFQMSFLSASVQCKRARAFALPSGLPLHTCTLPTVTTRPWFDLGKASSCVWSILGLGNWPFPIILWLGPVNPRIGDFLLIQACLGFPHSLGLGLQPLHGRLSNLAHFGTCITFSDEGMLYHSALAAAQALALAEALFQLTFIVGYVQD